MLLFSYLLMSGVTTGALYALVALGIVVVNKATGVINFAQGEFFMFTGFVGWMLHVQFGINYPLSFLLAVIVGFVLGMLTDRIAFRPIAKNDIVSLVLATVGIGFILKGLARVIWGGKADYLSFPPITSPDPIMVGPLMVIPQQLAVLAGTIIIMLVFAAFFRLTRAGKMMQATADNARAALLVGIRTDRIYTLAFGTGAAIAAAAAPKFKKLSLELGGKNPAIVFADADLSEANLDTIVRSGFANQGEICLCGSRLLVERSIYETFKQRYLAKVQALRVGDPEDPASHLGALVSQAHFDKVTGCIERARAEGGRVLAGGDAVRVDGRCAGGWFVAPTVIEGLPNASATNQEEIFGPVVTLIPFDGEDEAVALANGTGYGLAASLWTSNLDRAHRVSGRLEFGIVWVNCWLLRDLRTPFGGVKNSGVGREGGVEALRFFTEAKNVCLLLG